MVYQEVSLLTIKRAIGDLFPAEITEGRHLTPDNIHKLAASVGVRLKWQQISWWHSFKADDPSIGTASFIDLLLSGVSDANRVLLVTDEGLSNQIGFSFRFGDLDAFVEAYEERYQMEFFQDADYIFVIPEKKQISVLMHEGRYTIDRRP